MKKILLYTNICTSSLVCLAVAFGLIFDILGLTIASCVALVLTCGLNFVYKLKSNQQGKKLICFCCVKF